MNGRHPEGMRIILLYDRPALAGDRASREVANQLAAVEEALARLGCRAERLGLDLDLAEFKRRLEREKPDLVFNLVESLDASDRLQTVIPMLLENWRLPFTGSGSNAMFLANHKILAKRFLIANRLATPECVWLEGTKPAFLPASAPPEEAIAGAWIIKTVSSHASLHLDDASVIQSADLPRLVRRLGEAEDRFGQPFFAERFIKGREFNLSLIEAAPGEPETLPAAEIDFSRLPAGKVEMVGYAAKWDEESPEFLNTPRTFDLGGAAGPTARLEGMATAAWKALGLAGYARIDFRADSAGRLFILEANANPCLNPDAGLAAAAARAGLDYPALIRRLIRAGLNRYGI
ncbi:MAG: D-alanine--D-alanine ligase [Planctomycetota bacterium]|jgi:D-alanine-D-alanine ligase|nr:D-alanine--D-alanine ligase [Planctomycetota bacterium]